MAVKTDTDPVDLVIRHIRRMLAQGELGPGVRLPAERRLAEMFGVGRTHVRSALQKLEFYGLVRTFPQSGTVVAAMEVGAIEGLIADVLQIGEYDFRSLVEMRVLLETEAIRLCALRRTDEELDAIRAAMEDFLGHFPTPSRMEKDLDFHRAIARASHNNVLCSMLLVITPDILRKYDERRVDEDPQQDIVREHREMIDCIARRDPDRAVALMREHLSNLVRCSLQPEPEITF